MVETLETRRFLSAVNTTTALGNGNHLLTFDDSAQTIELRVVQTRPDGLPGPGIQVWRNGSLSFTDDLSLWNGITFIRTLGGNDSVTIGADVGRVCIDGGDGDDTLIGGNRADTLIGGAGNDVINGRGGSDRIAGQNGDDVLKGAAGFDTIDGGAGSDVLIGGENADRLFGGDGADFLLGGGGVDRLFGGADHSPDTLWGGAAVDRFYCRAFLNPGEILSDAVERELPWILVA